MKIHAKSIIGNGEMMWTVENLKGALWFLLWGRRAIGFVSLMGGMVVRLGQERS